MTAVRLVPLAPFPVVNAVAGAIHLRPRDFMVGSALGILPGTLVATVFSDQVLTGIRDPRSINLWLVAGLIAGLVICTRLVRRWLFGKATQPNVSGTGHPA